MKKAGPYVGARIIGPVYSTTTRSRVGFSFSQTVEIANCHVTFGSRYGSFNCLQHPYGATTGSCCWEAVALSPLHEVVHICILDCYRFCSIAFFSNVCLCVVEAWEPRV